MSSAIDDGWPTTGCPRLERLPANLSAHERDICAHRPDQCICSRGCQSSFACKPSILCHNYIALPSTASHHRHGVATNSSKSVPILLFLHFNRSHVRSKFQHAPWRAYERELRRIEWFVQSAQRVRTTLPIIVVVAGDRNATAEASLRAKGVAIIESPQIPPPPWASSFQRLSFSKISALALTQFRKVIVLDNDMVLLNNLDELASPLVEAPAAVWHATSSIPEYERAAPNTGLLVLKPSAAGFAAALAHLAQMSRARREGGTPRTQCYDGGDQEFWRSFYRDRDMGKAFSSSLTELPLRYHAHNGMVGARRNGAGMSSQDWAQVRALHSISGFRSLSRGLPRFVHRQQQHFTGDGLDGARLATAQGFNRQYDLDRGRDLQHGLAQKAKRETAATRQRAFEAFAKTASSRDAKTPEGSAALAAAQMLEARKARERALRSARLRAQRGNIKGKAT